MSVYEELTAAHFIEWGRDIEGFGPAELEAESALRLGWAVRGDDGALCAIGGVRWLLPHEREHGAEVHLMAWFDARGRRSKWVHRMAMELFAALGGAGERCVWAIPDPTIPGAERWLTRLGFAPHDNGVWRRELVPEVGLGRDTGLRPTLPGRG